MNIQEAKQELIHTIRAYTDRDEMGNDRIPRIHQRPVLLMGPPGIGKTAIVSQAAEACGVGLVSYTITHHTRQSAVGLPLIETKKYNGQEISVTVYTMSEIIASVYDTMEQTGCQSGILFIDEVNCASETLAPTMLQFLQAKTFGNHKVPRGWVIVAAGNPPEYNKSVREFDVVTLDRVKKITIEVDYQAWKKYAAARGIHGAVRSYLEGKPQYFYRVEQHPDEKEFVTARGWEDLSLLLTEYERLDVEITRDLVEQYLQCREIAADFTSYYHFYRAFQENYRDLLGELLGDGEQIAGQPPLPTLSLDKQLTLAELLISGVTQSCVSWQQKARCVGNLRKAEKIWERQIPKRPFCDQMSGENPDAWMTDFLEGRRKAIRIQEELETITEEEAAREAWANERLREIFTELQIQKLNGNSDGDDHRSTDNALQSYAEWVRQGADMAVGKWETEVSQEAIRCGKKLDRILGWLWENFGEGPAFLAALESFTAHEACMEIISGQECPVYEQFCGLLLISDRKKRLKEQVLRIQNTEL